MTESDYRGSPLRKASKGPTWYGFLSVQPDLGMDKLGSFAWLNP